MEQIQIGASKLETARVGGVDLAYVDKGKGDPVIFVHGGMTDLRSWLGTHIEPFSKGPLRLLRLNLWRSVASSPRKDRGPTLVGRSREHS